MLITVGTYLDPWEAHILRARLEAEGIPATVTGDGHMILNWPLSIALGGAKVQVPGPFLDKAQKVVAAYNAGDFEKDLTDCYPESADVCPECGSEKLRPSVSTGQRVLEVLITVLASAPFPPKAVRLRCSDCGHRWRYDD